FHLASPPSCLLRLKRRNVSLSPFHTRQVKALPGFFCASYAIFEARRKQPFQIIPISQKKWIPLASFYGKPPDFWPRGACLCKAPCEYNFLVRMVISQKAYIVLRGIIRDSSFKGDGSGPIIPGTVNCINAWGIRKSH